MAITSTGAYSNGIEARTAGRMPDVHVSAPAKTAGNASTQAKSTWSFLDFLDIINPLQHIPVVSTIYRAITGDEIKAPARVAGGALYGGPVGAMAGFVDAAAINATGKDTGDLVLALFDKKDAAPAAPETMLAAAKNLQTVSPASGAETDGIIWNSERIELAEASPSQPSLSPLLPHPLPPHTHSAATTQAPALPPIPAHASPELVKNAVLLPAEARQTGWKELLQPQGQAKAASQAKPTHDALAAAAERSVPSEQIAQWMMEGLQKYETMKKADTQDTNGFSRPMLLNAAF